MILNKFYVDDVIKNALLEDVNYVDQATAFVIPETSVSTARFLAKADGVLAGLEVALRVFELLDASVTAEVMKHDGDALQKGDVIATLTGPTRALLQGERTALNLLQHMSGVATATNRAVKLTEGTGAAIADTRKTLPGFNLSDAAMLKDNHIDAGGGITKTVSTLREKLGHTVKIEVETRNMDEVKEAVAVGADIIMLDNMTAEQMREATAYIAGRALTEASGNITLENLAEKAKSGVDIISMGALTHSVTALDISMKIK